MSARNTMSLSDRPLEASKRRFLPGLHLNLARRQAVVAYIFLAPMIIYFLVFFFYPIFMELWISLHRGQVLVGESQFAGLYNYLRAFSDPRVINSFKVTVTFSVGSAVLSVVTGIGLAALLNQNLRGRTFLRALIFFPYMTTFVIVALMWRNILDPYTGLLNNVLAALGLPTQNWLSSYDSALWAVLGITIWHSMGYNMVLFLAGMQGIPEVYHEAAEIDGANAWNKFRHITVPLLAPTTLFVSVMSVINSLQAFAQAYIITRGGPADATNFFVYHVFNLGFGQMEFGYASALSFLMFIFILILTLVQFRLGNRQIEY